MEAAIKLAASAASPEGFSAMIKSAVSGPPWKVLQAVHEQALKPFGRKQCNSLTTSGPVTRPPQIMYDFKAMIMLAARAASPAGDTSGIQSNAFASFVRTAS